MMFSLRPVLLLALTGCTPVVTVPPPPPERLALGVQAPFDRTWEAVIDVFATRSIPIATLDRSSGLVMALPLTVTGTESLKWANCPKVEGALSGYTYYPHRADFNVLVRSL